MSINVPTPSAGASPLTLQPEEADEKSNNMAQMFVSIMDNFKGCTPPELDEDMVMDWFGRFFYGRSSIIDFLRSRLKKTKHVIERVSRIPPVSHPLLKKSTRTQTRSPASSILLTQECGQGDCKGLSTPVNTKPPNLKELMKAPRIKRHSSCSVDWDKCEFLEIRGNLELEFDEGSFHKVRKLERIILGFTDQIHVVIYEGKASEMNNCRKRLFL